MKELTKDIDRTQVAGISFGGTDAWSCNPVTRMTR